MEAQWLLLGLALALTTMTVSAYVSPNGLVRGNLAWFACGWLATEFAPWLVAAAGVVRGPQRSAGLVKRAPGTVARGCDQRGSLQSAKPGAP